MNTSTESTAASPPPAVITYRSHTQDERPYVCAVPGQPSERFLSPDTCTIFAQAIAQRLGLKVKGGV